MPASDDIASARFSPPPTAICVASSAPRIASACSSASSLRPSSSSLAKDMASPVSDRGERIHFALLAGVLLKMGTYGMLRFNLGLFPEQSRSNAWWVMILALIGIIYGALVAMVQPNLKS